MELFLPFHTHTHTTHTHTHTHTHNTHTAVSTMSTTFLLLFLLLLLLQDVFNQEPSDNCTIEGAFLSSIPRVPRIGCTAQSCLSCREAKAECFHNTTSNTFTCTADTSTCSVQVCEPCQYCIGTFSSPITSQDFTLNSLCFELPHDKTCQQAEAAEWCALNGTISSADDIFMSSVVNVNRGSVHLICRCYGENCTERLLYTYSILPTSPPTIEPEAVITMETVSVLATPTTNVITSTQGNSSKCVTILYICWSVFTIKDVSWPSLHMSTEISLASYPGSRWAGKERAWYPLFAHALNFPEILGNRKLSCYIRTTVTT